MAKVESQTEGKKQIIIQKSKICNYGRRTRYLYENAAARGPGYTLSRSFQNSVMFQLPLYYSEKDYMQFIENWGMVAIIVITAYNICPCMEWYTGYYFALQHIIMAVDIGTKHILRSSSSYRQVYKYLKKKVCHKSCDAHYTSS